MEIGLTAGVNKGEFVQYNPNRAYSFYSAVIANIQRKLKYTSRYLKKTQKAFHYAEGRLHRALISQHKDDDGRIISEEALRFLRQEADLKMEQFCDAFKLRERLVAELQDAIHADRASKEKLHNFSTTTEH